MINILNTRHSGMDCRNLGYREVYRLPSMALDTGFPAGMTVYFNGVYNNKSPSFRHGLPESRLQGCIKMTTHGTGYRLPGRYDDLLNDVYNDKSPSFRHGLPESRLQGGIQITIHGTGYRLPGRYDGLL